MNGIRIAFALAGCRLTDALDVRAGVVRAPGGMTPEEVGLLHDLFDTVEEEVRDGTVAGSLPGAPVAASAVTLRALSSGLGSLSAELRDYQRSRGGGGDPVVLEQAACVARRAHEYRRLVDQCGGGAGPVARGSRGVPGLPAAGAGPDPGFRGVRSGVFPPAAGGRPGGVELVPGPHGPQLRADRKT